MAIMALGVVLSCLLTVGLGILAFNGLRFVADNVLPPPTAIVYVSSPDDQTWGGEMLLSSRLHKPVILTRVPDGIRRVEVRYQIPMSGNGRTLCDSNKPSGLGETFARREERNPGGTKLFQVVSVTMPGRGSAAELYAANVMLNFCGIDGYYRAESQWTYFLGFWYGTEEGFTNAVKHLKAKRASELQVTAP
jgi:hypothetical protein